MKKILFIVLFCFAKISYGQQSDCNKFKTGKFIIKDSVNGNLLVKRTASKEIWYNDKSKLKTVSEIKWVTNCSYVVHSSKVLENPNAIEFYESDIADTTKIIETRRNSYIEEIMNSTFMIVFEREVFKTNSY